MKNQIKTIAAALLMSALFSNTALAGNKDGESTDFVVNGVIVKTDKKTDSKCKLELFQENTLIESSEIKMNKPFERKLKKNVWYTLRITKEGYKPLLISLNTELDNNANVLDNLFEFETALINNEAAKFMDKDQLDFPVGLVAFNKDTQSFEARDIYTNNYMTALYKSTPVDAADVAVVYTNAKQNDFQVADIAAVYANANQAAVTADITKEYITHKKIAEGLC